MKIRPVALASALALTSCVQPDAPAAQEAVTPAGDAAAAAAPPARPNPGDAAGAALITRANAAIDDVAVDFQVGIPPSTYDAATMELTEDGDANSEQVGKRLDTTAAALERFQDKDDKLKPLVSALKSLQDRLSSLSPEQRWLANEVAERGAELAQGLETAPPRVKDEQEDAGVGKQGD